MFRKRSAAALLLAVLMLLSVFAGCSQGGSNQTQSPTQETSAATQAPQATETQPEETQAPEESASAISYPLSEETLEFTGFFQVGNFVSMYLPDADFNEIAAIKAANEACNVIIDAIMVDGTFYKEQLYTMLAGGDYPDFLTAPEDYYTGGIEALIADEICIDLVPYMQEYLPDYYNRVYSVDELYAKEITSDNGYVTTVRGRDAAIKAGAMIRQDWLDDLGLETPTTFDELHDVLLAFKNEKGADMAFMRTNGIIGSYTAENFIGGYDNLVASSYFSDIPWVIGDDGKVICSYMKPSFQGYIQMLADWFAEGLYSDDAFSLDGNPTQWFDYVYNNRTGFWIAGTTCLGEGFAASVNDPDCKIVAMADVTLNEGDSIDVGNSRGILGDGGWGVTTQCENIPEALMYINWFFTEEGHQVSNYGVEGEAHYVDDTGTIQFTDLIVNNENGATSSSMFCVYCNYFANPFDRTEWSLAATLDEEARSCFEIWTSNRTEDRVCHGSLNAEETEVYNATVGDIATYANEQIAAMCHGDIDVETFWPEFTAQLESMGIDELTALKQAAYDRYMAR